MKTAAIILCYNRSEFVIRLLEFFGNCSTTQNTVKKNMTV